MHPASHESMCNEKQVAITTIDEHAPLPFPWSLDPLPPTTPLLTVLGKPVDSLDYNHEPLFYSELVSRLPSNQSLTTSKFSRDALLELHDSVSHVF